MPKLSISIVVYQSYKDITLAIETIEKFTDNRIEKIIYVVDNSGKEWNDERRQFTEFLKQYDDIVYLDTGENLGFGRGHNFVRDRIDSEYHAIVNPDIIMTEDSFRKMIDYLESHEDVGMCIPKMTDEDGKVQLVYRRELTVWDLLVRTFFKKFVPGRYAYHTMQDMNYEEEFQVPFGQGSFLVVRTPLFKELGGFDDHYFLYMEDADFCKRVNAVSKLMYYSGTSVIHKWERGSHKNLGLLKCHICSAVYYFKKWGFRWS